MPWRITTGTGPSAFDTHLEYDAFERRIAKRSNDETTHYVGDIYEHVAKTGETEHRYKVFAGSQQVAQVVRTEVGGAVTATTTTYIHDDHLGSASTITNQAGAVVEARQYGPFGDTTTNFATTDLRTGFTGHQHDGELGLINMRGRLYDPALGQFVQADPFVATLNPRGLNRYAYVMNNPLMNTDPSGFSLLSIVARWWGWDDDDDDDPNKQEPGELPIPGLNPYQAAADAQESGHGDDAIVDLTGLGPVLVVDSVGPTPPGGGTAPDPGMGPSLGWNGTGDGAMAPPGYNGNFPSGGTGSGNQPLPNNPDAGRGNFIGTPPTAAAAAAAAACAANPACALTAIVGAWAILQASPALQEAVGKAISQMTADPGGPPPIARDSTGKVHDDLPSYVPESWTVEDVETSARELEQSIAKRNAEQKKVWRRGWAQEQNPGRGTVP